MNPADVQTLVAYRVEQAHETLADARFLLEHSSLRGAVNRAYYAMFYIVLALLIPKQFGTSKHSNVLALFDREFVKTGIFDKDYSRAFQGSFNLRQKQDYRELVTLDQHTAE